jgi:hypothetical protein
MADALRVFVVTWDPLELLAGRPAGFATANAAASDLDELVVYVPVWSLVELATEEDVTPAAVLGSMAGSAVVTAAAHEQSVIEGRYPALVVAQEAPDLLSDPAAGAVLGPVDVRLVSDEWEDIGLGAITDVVQHAFGPVDLDRSLVELVARSEPSRVARRVRAADSASRQGWPKPELRCALPTNARRAASSTRARQPGNARRGCRRCAGRGGSR